MYQPLETDDIGSPDIEFREKNYEGRSVEGVTGGETCDYWGGAWVRHSLIRLSQ